MPTNKPLDPHAERDALRTLTALEPPDDFTDRVLAAALADAAPPHGPAADTFTPELAAPARWWRVAVAGLAVAAAAGGLGVLLSRPDVWQQRQPSHLRVSVDEGPRPEGAPPLSAQASPLPEAPADKPRFGDALRLGELDRTIPAYIAGYGAGWGRAFAFHGALALAQDGEILFKRDNFGEVSQPDPVYRIGTLTSLFTAVAALQLAERGRLDLDADVCTYVPEFCAAHRPYGREIVTARHLLSHTSGIPNYTDDLYLEVWSAHPKSDLDLLKIVAAQPLEFAPGSDFDPSNSGFVLLGEVITRVGGSSDYQQYISDQILAPAGMHSTRFDLQLHADKGPLDERRALDLSRQVMGRQFNDELEDLEGANEIQYGRAAGGLWSNVEDLVRFDHALHSGRLLSEASLAAMSTPVRDNYGLGWILGEAFGQPTIGHPGGAAGYNGAILRLRGVGLTAVVLSGTEIVDSQTIAEDLLALAHGRAAEAPREPAEQPLDRALHPRYVGDYALDALTRRRYEKVIAPEHLARLDQVKVVESEGRLRLSISDHGSKWMHPSGPDAFFFKDTAGTTAAFGGPEGGAATNLTLRTRDAIFTFERSR
ncbi:MAG: beta-lactamase family protein [Nannocystis sp.]|nr:beta-lactamase family protein [Nannocystis sp.]